MPIGGELDSNVIRESFSRVKSDIEKLNIELYNLKLDQKRLLEENFTLKKKLSEGNGHQVMDKDMISQIVQETIKNIKPKSNTNDALIKRLNKKRSAIIRNRFQALADEKNLSLSDIKERIVDQENLCSKATFYRYAQKMKDKGLIDIIQINESEVVVRL